MGLGGMKYAWQRQTRDFAHNKADQYSSLVTDNRGIGDSDKPTSRYSTSEMAKDMVEVLDHIGWTGKRELHVIGISMGGMIAQEIVRLTFHHTPPVIRGHHASGSKHRMPDFPFSTQIHPSRRCQGLQTSSNPSDTRHSPVILAVQPSSVLFLPHMFTHALHRRRCMPIVNLGETSILTRDRYFAVAEG